MASHPLAAALLAYAMINMLFIPDNMDIHSLENAHLSPATVVPDSASYVHVEQPEFKMLPVGRQN